MLDWSKTHVQKGYWRGTKDNPSLPRPTHAATTSPGEAVMYGNSQPRCHTCSMTASFSSRIWRRRPSPAVARLAVATLTCVAVKRVRTTGWVNSMHMRAFGVLRWTRVTVAQLCIRQRFTRQEKDARGAGGRADTGRMCFSLRNLPKQS